MAGDASSGLKTAYAKTKQVTLDGPADYEIEAKADPVDESIETGHCQRRAGSRSHR